MSQPIPPTNDATNYAVALNQVDPAITAFLESHGAVGVPLYVVYPRQGEPVVLPAVLTQATVEQALAEAAR